MFTKTELKIYAIEAIRKSNNPIIEKSELVTRLKKCSLTETMAFLNKGQMLDEKVKLTQKMKDHIKKEFNENEKLIGSITEVTSKTAGRLGVAGSTVAIAGAGATYAGASGVGAGLIGAGLAALIISDIIKAHKSKAADLARICGPQVGAAKTKCHLQFKIKTQQQEISALNSGRPKCKGDKKCIEKLNIKIKDSQDELKVLNDKLDRLIAAKQ